MATEKLHKVQDALDANMSRRTAVFGAAAAGLAAFGNNRFSSEVAAQESDAPAQDSVEQGGDVALVDGLASNEPLFANQEERLNPNFYSKMVPDQIQDAFSLTTAEIPNPEDHAEPWSELFGTALILGCTAEDMAEFYIPNATADQRQAAEDAMIIKMDEKYTIPAYRGLIRNASDDDLMRGDDFDRFSRMRKDILLRCLDRVYKTNKVDDFPIVKMTGQEVGADMGSDGYGTYITLSMTNDFDDGDTTKSIYSVEGTIRTHVRLLGSGRVTTWLVIEDPWDNLFDDFHSKINS